MDALTTNAPAPLLSANGASAVAKWIGGVQGPLLRLYHSYGNGHRILIMGHALQYAPQPDDIYHTSTLNNTHSLLKLFMVKALPYVKVCIRFGSEVKEVQSAEDGFFSTDWDMGTQITKTWSDISAELADYPGIRTESRIYTPFSTPYIFLSDIDDTFLVSHSDNLLRRLVTLFTNNARTREAFPGVVEHYKYLEALDTSAEKPNPFFYISSSEWNLYDYLKEFCRFKGFPEGIFLLSSLKGITSFWKTGLGRHESKYIRIVRILKEFSGPQYVLFGDDSQKDPEIYAKLVADFPGRIKCVYIRHRVKDHLAKTRAFEAQIKALGVEVCYFTHSKTALGHSQRFFGGG